jgi:diguanylate cyclase (GGDEF)-like protein/PAS domain S-box-containing protein
MIPDTKNLFEENLDLEQILTMRTELEKYIEVIDEYVITSKTDLKGNINYVSKAFAEISGYETDELIGKNHNVIRHPDMPSSLFKDMWSTIKNKKTWSGEIKNKRKDGSSYWVNVKITPTYDNFDNHIGFTSVRQDITDKKRIEELSLTDELTQLYNRRHFNQVIDIEIKRSCRDHKVFSFVVLDIDNFKKYNDNYGHQKGDEILKQVASYLKNSLKRATDVVFRLGGEEFGIIYLTNDVKQAIKLSKNICKGIEELHLEHRFNTASEYVTASFGLAICDNSTNIRKDITKELLYDIADQQLYIAKKSSRNRVCYLES